MLTLILGLLILLWILGYINIPQLPLNNTVILNLLGKNVTLYDLLITLIILWLIGIIPSPFRQIASVLFLLWILAFFGIIAITNFSNIIVIAIIVGLAFYILSGYRN
jgi:hypothetical protein